MFRLRYSCPLILVAAILLSTASLKAALLNENFDNESRTYTLTATSGKTFTQQNASFRDNGGSTPAVIVQGTDSGVNTTQVLKQNATAASSITYSASLNYLGSLTGDVHFQVDFKLTGTAGTSAVYLFGSDSTSNRPLWITFSHQDDSTAAVTLKGNGDKTLSNIQIGHWYRLDSIIHVNAMDGTKTAYEVTLSDLTDPNLPVLTSTLVNSYGSPTDIGRPELYSASGAVDYFDNWEIVVPEPASLSLLGLGGLLLVRRRHAKAR